MTGPPPREGLPFPASLPGPGSLGPEAGERPRSREARPGRPGPGSGTGEARGTRTREPRGRPWAGKIGAGG